MVLLRFGSKALGNDLHCPNQRLEQRFIYIHFALILSNVSQSMGVIQHSPALVREIQRVFQALKDDVTTLRPRTDISKRRKRKRMRRVES